MLRMGLTYGLSLLLLLSCPWSSQAACRLRLDIQPDQSTFSLSGTNTIITQGTNTPPLQGGIKDVASITKGLAGAMFGSSTTLAACPTSNTAADWLAALPSFTFTSSVPYYDSPVSLWPPVLNATTAGFVYEPRNLELDVNVTIISTDPATSTFQMQLSAKVARGWLYSSTPVTSTRWDNLANLTTTSTETGSLSVQTVDGSPTLVLQVPKLFLNITNVGTATRFTGSDNIFTTITTIYLNGQMKLQAVLGCPKYCGDRGRCVAGSVATGAGCQCECGWSLNADGMCSEPLGHCDLFPNSTVANSVVVVQQPSTPSQCVVAAPQEAAAGDSDRRPLVVPMDAMGTCQEGYTLNPAGTGCARCSIGYTGMACAACQSDEGCRVATRAAGATCWRNATYGPRSAGKNYTCTTVDDNVRGLLGDTLAFSCSTVPPANASAIPAVAALVGSRLSPIRMVVGYTPYCTMSFRMPTFMVGSYAVCSGWDCSFGRDSSRVSCSVVTCDCPQGCMTKSGEDMAPTFKGTSGSISITCDPAASPDQPQDCRVDLTGLPIDSVRTRCMASECYNPAFGQELGFVEEEKSSRSSQISNPVIAVIPLLVLGALLIAAIALVAGVRPYISGTPKAATSTNHLVTAPVSNGQALAEGVELVPTTSSSEGDSQHVASSWTNASAAQQVHVILDAKVVGASEQALYFRFMNIQATSKGSWLSRQRAASSNQPDAQPSGFKRILNGISGCAGVGEVVGIMGPSGSGKSTLLNVLSGQIQDGGAWHVSGDITLGRHTLTHRQLCHVTACVPQHDLLLRFLTVEECLRSSAALRLGPDVTPSQVWQRTDQVLRELNMHHLKDSRCYQGNHAVLSGGERQRVSIGMELVTDPKILMLDEPTSGLDSYNALQVMLTIQDIASAGRVVMTSLHQPSPVIFNMLSRAILIAKGYVVFQGQPASALAAFDKLAAPCPPANFIAEHMLEVVGSPDHVERILSHVASPGFRDHMNEHVMSIVSGGDKDGASSASSGFAADPQVSLKPSTPVLRSLGVLLWRTLADVGRNPMLAALHIVFAIVMGLICGFVYFRIENNTAGAQNRVGSLFFILNLMAFLGITSMDILQNERLVSEREMARRYYGPALYMAQKVLIDNCILRVIPAFIFGTIFYWLAGFRSQADSYLVFIFVFSVWHSLSGTMALACCAIISSPGRSSLVFTCCLLLSILFAGFLVNKSSISWALRWLCYISPMRYSWEALSINELKPMILTLNAPGLPPVPPVQGRLFLGLLGVDPDDLVQDLVIMNCMYAILVLIGMAAMWGRVKLIQKGWS